MANILIFSAVRKKMYFCRKNINVFENTLATTDNQFVIDKLVRPIFFEQLDPGLYSVSIKKKTAT